MLPLRCAKCGYDLSGLTTDSGVCPECATPFSKTLDQRRLNAFTLLALRLFIIGALGAAFLGLAGRVVSTFPSPDGAHSSGAEAANLLQAVPEFILCWAVAMLGIHTGRTPSQRRWPLITAAAYALVMLFDLGTQVTPAYRIPTSTSAPPFQIQNLGPYSHYLHIVAWWALIVAASLITRRAAADLGLFSIRRIAMVGLILAAIGFLSGAGRAVQPLVIDMNTLYRAASTSNNYSEVNGWQAFLTTLNYLSRFCSLAAELILALSALTLRTDLLTHQRHESSTP